MLLISRSFRTAALCLIGVATMLQGCGGGESSSPSTPPLPADYLRVGVVSSDVNAGRSVVFFDSEQPATPRLKLRLTAAENYRTFSPQQINSVAQTSTTGAESAAYVVQGGRVYRVGLKKSEATVAQRVSSLTTACSVFSTRFLSPDETGWVVIEEAGPDNDCDASSDNRDAFVRPVHPANVAPVMRPDGISVHDKLPDASFARTQYIIGTDAAGGAPAELTLYSPDLNYAGPVTGGAGVTHLTLLNGAWTVGRTFVRANNQLKLLSWNNSGATLSAQSLYNFTGSSTRNVADSGAIYFADGLKIVRVTNAGVVQTIATVNSAQGSIVDVAAVVGDKLLITQFENPNSPRTLYALNKTGGTPVPLDAGVNLFVLGTTGSTLYYAAFYGDVGNAPSRSIVQRVNLDGTQKSIISATAEGFPDVFRQRVRSLSDNHIDGLIWCEPAPGGTPHCANGSLKMLNTNSGATTVLGTFSHGNSYDTWSPLDYSHSDSYQQFWLDLPMVLRSRGMRTGTFTAESELHIARPGIANSLVKVNMAP